MKRRFGNFLYNFDRALASLVLGAPPQETISSEAARHADKNRLARWLTAALNKIDPGHGQHAEAHADRLDRADDGIEK